MAMPGTSFETAMTIQNITDHDSLAGKLTQFFPEWAEDELRTVIKRLDNSSLSEFDFQSFYN